MSIASLLKRLTQALPVILANAPVVVEVVKQVRQALKKPKPPEGDGEPAPARERLAADRGGGAR